MARTFLEHIHSLLIICKCFGLIYDGKNNSRLSNVLYSVVRLTIAIIYIFCAYNYIIILNSKTISHLLKIGEIAQISASIISFTSKWILYFIKRKLMNKVMLQVCENIEQDLLRIITNF